MTYDKIIETIDSHLARSSKPYWGDYFIGITGNLEEQLAYLKVPKNNFWYVWCRADNPTIARQAEKHYLAKGMEGSPASGDNPLFVYCYEIAQFTREA